MISRISVVVLRAERDAELHRTLDAIARTGRSNIEVVIHAVAAPAALGIDSSDVKLLRDDGWSLATTGNRALAVCAGDVVVFIRCGARPRSTWLDDLGVVFCDEEVAVSGGPLLDERGVAVSLGCWAVDSLGRQERLVAVPLGKHWSSPWSERLSAPDWANAAFRRSTLLEIGGFDERYEGQLTVADVCRRLLDRGCVINLSWFAAVHQEPGATFETASWPIDAHDDRRLFAVTHGFANHSTDEIARALGSPPETPMEELTEWSEPLCAAHSDSAAFPVIRPSARRLHVCYVAQERLPVHNGVARLVHARASGLAERGHVVRVLTLTDGPLRVDLEGGIWVHRVPSTPHPPPPMVMPPRLWERSASVLDELLRIDAFHSIDLVDVPNWDVEGYATILDGRFTTVLGLHSGVAAYVATDSRFASDDPIVQEVLNAELACYRGADAFLAASRAIIAEIESAFDVMFPTDRLGLVPHGLPPEPESPDAGPEADGALTILFVGRLEPRKGIDTLLDAIPIVLDREPDARFMIVGDDRIEAPGGGTYRRRFERSAAGRACGDRVTFTGIVSDAELTDHYRRCDVFVAPSRFESFGLILLEAMRIGKPVVAGDAGGMREVVGEEGAGILVPPGDVDALAGAILDLLADPATRASVGRKGKLRYDARFTRDRMIDGIEAFYERLVEEKTSGRLTED